MYQCVCLLTFAQKVGLQSVVGLIHQVSLRTTNRLGALGRYVDLSGDRGGERSRDSFYCGTNTGTVVRRFSASRRIAATREAH